MNKLIIAGNGFDLAHGLPTSYNNFMDAFWRDLPDWYLNDLIKETVHIDELFNDFLFGIPFLNYKEFIKSINFYINKNDFEKTNVEYEIIYPEDTTNKHKIKIFEFKNQFFKELNEIQSIQNWVDVENEYYKKLKSIVKAPVRSRDRIRIRRNNVLKLHKEFEQVKQLLERYLQKNVVEAYDFSYGNDNFIEIIEPVNYEEMHESFIRELSSKKDKLDFLELEAKRRDSNNISKNKSQILNFNYTNTLNNYEYKRLDDRGNSLIKINHIHGKLEENIVFGFGDEMDDDYKLIEDMDDNEYLRYFKSFQYVQNSNYKDVLRYIDSEKFQVIIMGHSCGLSDRTLLNTIFEHENCRSIKVFYYKNGEYDNYTEIIQNISRHFNDKKLMRTKIVEKTLCEPMPQIQLSKKK
ncbi:AbiH family protein [uncultured Kordia sp.]|uniref:AbiH family protein n=1 Tax=uncultured Kordia sp. TaxID=507699 RepID=UPI00260C86CF|nr:AbiH family protein [uncultured Kordia sp.]